MKLKNIPRIGDYGGLFFNSHYKYKAKLAGAKKNDIIIGNVMEISKIVKSLV